MDKATGAGDLSTPHEASDRSHDWPGSEKRALGMLGPCSLHAGSNGRLDQCDRVGFVCFLGRTAQIDANLPE